VESKASSSIQPVEPLPNNEPFAKGKDQVTATLDALWEVLAPPLTSLQADLRFSSFVEHLAAVALSNLYPIRVSDEEAVYATRLISDFSRRKLSPNDQPEEFHIDGAVVCTQFRSAVSRKIVWHSIPGRNRSWQVALARVGTDDIDIVLGKQLSQMAKIPEQEVPVPEPTSLVPVSPIEAQVVQVPGASPRPTAEESDLAQDLFLACRQRGFPLDEPDPADIIVGPAVVSIPMSLRAGASIRPIEGALEDLAREVGVASVVVENDPDRPFHIRFIVARRHREFVSLPETPAPLLEADTQSYLGMYFGRTLQGRDFAAFVSSWTHMLVGGTTGSGKTTFIRSLLRQLPGIRPELIRVIIVDGKGEIDYLRVVPAEYFTSRFPEVILGHTGVQEVFNWIVEDEMPRRRKLLVDRARQAGVVPARSARDLFVSSASSGTAVSYTHLTLPTKA